MTYGGRGFKIHLKQFRQKIITVLHCNIPISTFRSSTGENDLREANTVPNKHKPNKSNKSVLKLTQVQENLIKIEVQK